MGDKTRGLYGKFRIERTDGKSAAGEKHEACEYFVLDLMHDPHALPALREYARSCRSEYPLLADDLDKWLDPRTEPLMDALDHAPDLLAFVEKVAEGFDLPAQDARALLAKVRG